MNAAWMESFYGLLHFGKPRSGLPLDEESAYFTTSALVMTTSVSGTS